VFLPESNDPMETAEIEKELILQALSVALSELNKQTVFRGQLKVALRAKRQELVERHASEDQLRIADKLIAHLRG
jgi:hypothetical protein